ncbi:G-protein alpha subunit-domain-containing protein [Mycena polygramma]|nr:G-protein alpha subunit-domain-containing protein [Mycena polygramma]
MLNAYPANILIHRQFNETSSALQGRRRLGIAIDAAIHERGLRRRIKHVVVLQNAGKTPEPIFPSSHLTEFQTDVPVDNNVHPPAVNETSFVVEVASAHCTDVQRLEAILTCVHREIGLVQKWFTCFNEVAGIIFLADISSYDGMVPSAERDEPVNCLRAAMSKFEATCTRYSSSLPTIILILNKMDIFTSKLASSPFSAHFPEYRGANAAAEYCKELFCFSCSNGSTVALGSPVRSTAPRCLESCRRLGSSS